MLSLLLFQVGKSMYNLNSDMRNINTWQKFKFHQHSTNPSLFKKEFTPSALKCSVASLKVEKIIIVILCNLKQH
jgi:transaldolase